MYVSVPQEGTPVPSNIAKRAGPYLLGPTLGSSPVKSIVQCLARLEGSDEFYTLKVIFTFILYLGVQIQVQYFLNIRISDIGLLSIPDQVGLIIHIINELVSTKGIHSWVH